MDFYKKVLITLSGAGLISSCAPVSNITKPVTARVVNITKYHYLDQNGDGTVDNCLYINAYWYYTYIGLHSKHHR